ncbi:uncharacterized protein LOC132134036 isoform X4 [Carassius carassius]|uniref:uncharacterized protein LOC132134036 isoform X4 n=1 Tax=Carassius carassius TaxID=217509 RepID=UPI002869733B|nr:uncharacterized protein LOC132134036 isoform X4 [Carassius carassius]
MSECEPRKRQKLQESLHEGSRTEDAEKTQKAAPEASSQIRNSRTLEDWLLKKPAVTRSRPPPDPDPDPDPEPQEDPIPAPRTAAASDGEQSPVTSGINSAIRARHTATRRITHFFSSSNPRGGSRCSESKRTQR